MRFPGFFYSVGSIEVGWGSCFLTQLVVLLCYYFDTLYSLL